MGFANRAFVAAGVGFAVSAIVGCGSSGGRLLSATESNRLSEQLNRVTEALAEQRCSTARQYLSQFQATVANLGEVNSTLISNLDQGASTIESLANSACQTQTATTPKKTHSNTSTNTTTTTQKTQTYTNPTTTTYTQPTYSQTYTQPTNTTGGTCPTCGGTTATTSTTTDTTPSTTTPNGGTGLGGTDTSTTGTSTGPPGGGGGGG